MSCLELPPTPPRRAHMIPRRSAPGRDAPATPAPHPDTDIDRPRGSEASSIWSTICANRYAKVGSHLAAQIARYKVGAEFRPRCTRPPPQHRGVTTQVTPAPSVAGLHRGITRSRVRPACTVGGIGAGRSQQRTTVEWSRVCTVGRAPRRTQRSCAFQRCRRADAPHSQRPWSALGAGRCITVCSLASSESTARTRTSNGSRASAFLPLFVSRRLTLRPSASDRCRTKYPPASSAFRLHQKRSRLQSSTKLQL